MEEELNEHDLEERLYAMIHHVDETQNNLIDSNQTKFDTVQFVENRPRSTLRRYWRTETDTNNQKSNVTKDPAVSVAKTTKELAPPSRTSPKEEKSPPKPPSPVDLSLFQSPVPQNVKKIIEFLDHEEENPVLLESSDEDEVVEVALPPKPTITIESSDEEELHIVEESSPQKPEPKPHPGDRAVSASPVPSVVSSVSDEFIRGDCIALNISSRHPDKHSFDFSLHGSDLLLQSNSSSRKKKRKKNKEATTSTPIVTADKAANADACFATPKSKAKDKKQKSRLFTEKSVSNPEVYDSDSNLSTLDINKNKNPYIVTEKSLPSSDVYESDSNQSEIVKETNTDQSKDKYIVEEDSSDSNEGRPSETPIVSKKNVTQPDSSEIVDLTANSSYTTINDTGICDSIVIGNITGFTESMDYGDDESTPSGDISKYVSSKVPSILNDNLDFDNLKGNEKVCKKRRYSLTTLRAEMEKFYNESWGGEDFNHKEIQKNMSRDKSLWAIDPKDKMQSFAQRKVKCNYCNRVGHRDDTCRQKPPVCYMCGNVGHYEPRCPTKICVNCGAPNFMYSTMCRNCSAWPRLRCAECGQSGHPASHCPDVWRRYHNTINTDTPLESCTQPKKSYQQYCSGCARRGHLVHSCRVTLPFSGLPINSPHVQLYRPIYAYTPTRNTQLRSKSFSDDLQRPEKCAKRVSKSPTVHETHINKKRNMSTDAEIKDKSPAPAQKNNKEADIPKSKNKNVNKSLDSVTTSEKAPDFIPVNSSNHDQKGRVIQDNEVSDTSDAVTSSRIYVTNDIVNKLNTKEGEEWLKETVGKLNVTVGPTDVNSFLSITGKIADQEVFQTELREWVQNSKPKNKSADVENTEELRNTNLPPKNRHKLLEHLNRALRSLNHYIGDPRALYKELKYSQNQHKKLLKQKVISPQRLMNSRSQINNMLKKLNIILIGQAGLADGTEHLNELMTFKDKLMSSREKNIAMSVRKEIGEHYESIFSSYARDDYLELMNKYYMFGFKEVAGKFAQQLREGNAFTMHRKQAPNSDVKQSIPSGDDNPVENMPPPATQDFAASHNSTPNHNSTAIQNSTVNQNSTSKHNSTANQSSTAIQNVANNINNHKCLRDLMFFTRKLTSLRNSGACPRNAKTEMIQLMRKIHPCIVMLNQNKNMNSKQTKKVKKVQQQAKKFLAKM